MDMHPAVPVSHTDETMEMIQCHEGKFKSATWKESVDVRSTNDGGHDRSCEAQNTGANRGVARWSKSQASQKEEFVEVLSVLFIDVAVGIPVAMQRRIRTVEGTQQTVEVLKVPPTDKMMKILVIHRAKIDREERVKTVKEKSNWKGHGARE